MVLLWHSRIRMNLERLVVPRAGSYHLEMLFEYSMRLPSSIICISNEALLKEQRPLNPFIFVHMCAHRTTWITFGLI